MPDQGNQNGSALVSAPHTAIKFLASSREAQGSRCNCSLRRRGSAGSQRTLRERDTLCSPPFWRGWDRRAASIKKKSSAPSSPFSGFPFRGGSQSNLANDSTYGLAATIWTAGCRKRLTVWPATSRKRHCVDQLLVGARSANPFWWGQIKRCRTRRWI